MRLLRGGLRHGAHARGLRRRRGLNKIARFRLDPRDTRTDEDFYELVGDDDGVFGCMTLLGCHDVCPKQLPLATQIAFICGARWWRWPGNRLQPVVPRRGGTGPTCRIRSFHTARRCVRQ
jgi:hypothetical protein